MAVTIELLRSGSPPICNKQSPFNRTSPGYIPSTTWMLRRYCSIAMRFCFKTVAQKFQLIEDGFSAPLVIPFAGHHLLHELREDPAFPSDLRQLQRYTINVPTLLRDVH